MSGGITATPRYRPGNTYRASRRNFCRARGDLRYWRIFERRRNRGGGEVLVAIPVNV